MIKYGIIFFVLYAVIFIPVLHAGEIEFIGNDFISERQILNSLNISQDDSTIVSKIEEFYNNSGFFNMKISDIEKSNNKTVITINEGLLSLIEKIELINIDTSKFNTIMIIKSNYTGEVASKENLDNFGEEILFSLADNGYPYARGEWDYFEFCDSVNLCLGFKILAGPKTIISGISFSGINRTKPVSIIKNINVSKGELYSESTILNSEIAIESMPYLEISSPFTIVSKDDGNSCDIVYYVSELPSTKFDGVGGFVNIDDRADFYGNISIEFGDILGTGRSFNINWDKKDKYSNNLRIGYLEPYFPSDNMDMTFELYQEDKDSLYLKSGGRIGAVSRFNNKLTGNIWLAYDRVEPENNSVIPSSNNRAVGVKFDFNNTDLKLNPQKGYEFGTEIEYKYRSNKDIESEIQTPTHLSSLGFSSSYYLNTGINLVSMLAFDGWGIITENDNITADEYRFVGGFDLLRGYSEDRFPAYRYLIGTIEQRVITGKYSRLYLFGDFGAIANSPINESYKFYPGYGFGLQVPTIPGTFKLEIAWGDTGFPENLILNFGFVSRF